MARTKTNIRKKSYGKKTSQGSGRGTKRKYKKYKGQGGRKR